MFKLGDFVSTTNVGLEVELLVEVGDNVPFRVVGE